MAQKAGKAAPALAVVGALAAGPQMHEAAAPARTSATQVIDARLDVAIVPAKPAHAAAHTAAQRAGRTYPVRPGDTLSAIALRFYGRASDWHWLYQANRAQISQPDLIYVGQVLSVPHGPPASFTAGSTARTDGDGDHDGDNGDGPVYKPRHARHHSHHSGGGFQPAGSSRLGGTLGCGGLEALWRSAGGSPWAAVTAASIAMAESGGNQYATGSVGERGYWQINPVNGALSTYDAYGNARAAVLMSHGGTDWSAWTTWTSGAYAGRC